MRQILLLFILGVPLCCTAFALPKPIDKHAGFFFQATASDTTKVKAYTRLASEFLKKDLETSKKYADSAIALGEKIKFYSGVSTAYRVKGIATTSQGKNQEASRFFHKALSYAYKKNSRQDITRSYNDLANISHITSKLDSAIYFAKKSLALDSTARNKMLAYSALATTYRLKDEYPTALSYYIKTLALTRAAGNRSTETKILFNIGNLHGVLNQHNEALHYFKQAHRIFDTLALPKEYANLNLSMAAIYTKKRAFAEADKYNHTALRVANKFGLEGLKGHVLMNLGKSYHDRGLYQQARAYFNRARQLALATKDQSLQAQLSIAFANTYFKENKPDLSAKEAQAGLRLSEKLGLLAFKADAYQVIQKIDSVQGRHQNALANYKKARAIDDSLFNLATSRQLIEIKEKYEAEKKAKEILKLQQEVEKKEAEVIKQKYKLYALMGALLALGLAFTLFYFRWKARRDKKRQEEVILRHKEVILAQEEVQKKISRDLHDDIGQKMVALKMNIEEGSFAGSGNTQNVLSFLNGITSDIRSLSHTLSPHILQTEGLQQAFEKLLKTTFYDTSVRYSLEYFNLQEQYPYETEINVYRIGQELITNIIKHARASLVVVQLYQSGSWLILIVEDDGKGFDTATKKGFGLENIESRVQMLKGVFHCESANGKTTSTIRIPV